MSLLETQVNFYKHFLHYLDQLISKINLKHSYCLVHLLANLFSDHKQGVGGEDKGKIQKVEGPNIKN